MTSTNEIFWRSERAPIIEAENVSYRIEAFLEGMTYGEEWAVLPTPNDRDAAITVHAAEQAVGKKHTSWDRTERTILATRVRRLSW